MSDLAPVPVPPPKRSKLLVASLALNFLVLGLFGGAVFARHRFGGPHDLNVGRIMGDPGLHGFVRTLPKERRAVLRASGEQARQTLKPLRETAQQTRLAATAAMDAVAFDPARVEKAMNDWIAAETAARRASVSVLVGAVSQMTAEERAQFQDWRKKHEHMPPPGRGPAEAGPTPGSTEGSPR